MPSIEHLHSAGSGTTPSGIFCHRIPHRMCGKHAGKAHKFSQGVDCPLDVQFKEKMKLRIVHLGGYCNNFRDGEVDEYAFCQDDQMMREHTKELFTLR